ncbi:MAG: tetratricopeptide repeat protein, partial [Candidatus Promineifilaceae bacterium]|nr:tetratricopeptide repeat protein [Candidatus Promineifilaceae bacterium]
LNPFVYFLRRYFDQSASEDEQKNKNLYREILDRLLNLIPAEDLRNELQRAQSFIGSLLGLHWEGSLYEQLEPELRFENTLGALKALIKAESLIQPVIILLEDADWLDDDSIEFLERLTRNVADYPLALLVTSRSEVPPSYFDHEAPQRSIKLRALGLESIGELAAAELDYQPSQSLVQLLTERTDGNPFYVQQLLLYLRENELLEVVEKQVGATLPGDVYIPTDVRTLLTSRLDRLPPKVKDVAQKAAVLGREFEIPILTYMVNRDPQLDTTLEAGDAEEIWFKLSDKSYIFNHALLRDAAYDMQLQSRLRQLHHLAANAYEDQYEREPAIAPRYAQIAYHFDRAEDAENARQYYGQAGDQAKEDYHNEEAIAFFSRGIELTPISDSQSKFNLLCGRETIYQWEGRREEQRKDLAQLARILEQHPDNIKQADLTLRQSAFALVTGDYETAVAWAKQSLEFAQKADNIEAEAKAYHRWGRTLWQQGRAQVAEEPILKALKLIQDGEYRQLEAMCHYDLFVVYYEQAKFNQAVSQLKLAEQDYETVNDKEGLARCRNGLGTVSYARADYSKAIDYFEQALDLCRKIGWRYVEPRSLANIGSTYFDLGFYDLAQDFHEQSVEICREIENLEIEAISLDTLGLIAHYLGNEEDAVIYYKNALDILAGVDNKGAAGYTFTHLGYTLFNLERYQEAELVLNQALNIRREIGADALLIDTLAGLTHLKTKQGDFEKAHRYVTQILNWIAENGTEGIELPVLVYYKCFQVMQELAEIYSISLHTVQEILEAGHVLLEEHALRIKDPELRQHFLENVPYNRLLQLAWQNSQ